MQTLWLCFVALMFALYFVFDGFDLGAGATQLITGKSDEERGAIIRSIGPVWDGNEVWLIAGGGTLYFAFPPLYAAGFSGLYLPLMMILWLLIGRGVAMEVRSHLDHPLWVRFWDVVFSTSSLALTFIFGAALGNLIRGVQLDAEGWFFLPLWTDFGVAAPVGVLDWFTIITGATTTVMLSFHGLLWVALKTSGALGERAQVLAGRAFWLLAPLSPACLLLSAVVQPHFQARLLGQPLIVIPALAALVLARIFLTKGRILPAFLASSAHILGMLLVALYCLFPSVLPGLGGEPGLLVEQAAASDYGLRVALLWWLPGMGLVSAYFVFLYRSFRGKVDLGEPGY